MIYAVFKANGCGYGSLWTARYSLIYGKHLLCFQQFKYQENVFFHVQKYQQLIECFYQTNFGIFLPNPWTFLRRKSMHHRWTSFIYKSTKDWSKSSLIIVLSRSIIIIFSETRPNENQMLHWFTYKSNC